MSPDRPMRKGWRHKIRDDYLVDETERAHHNRLLSSYRASRHCLSWEWTVRWDYCRPPLAWGGANSEPKAQAAAEAALEALLTAAPHELRGEPPA